MIPTEFFDLIQKSCLPGIWSKGVAIARTDSVIEDSRTEDELIFRVRVQDLAVSKKVTLWPTDEDWFCDCNDRNDVCPHVAAVVASLRMGRVKSVSNPTFQSQSPQVLYRFSRQDGNLAFERVIARGSQNEEPLLESLVSYNGGIQSGRIHGSPIVATKEDYAVDSVISEKRKKIIDRESLIPLFRILSECSNIYLDQEKIVISAKPISFKVIVTEEGEGFRLARSKDLLADEVFENGAALYGTILKAIELPTLSTFEKQLLNGSGHFFSSQHLPRLVLEVLPELSKKMEVEISTQKLPKVLQIPPKIVLKTEKDPSGDVLWITPKIIYESSSLTAPSNVIIAHDPAMEKILTRKLQNELQLAPDQPTSFRGQSAVDFLIRLKDWEVTGSGVTPFSLKGTLNPVIDVSNNSFSVSFQISNTSKLDLKQVLQAWRENQSFVPLLTGGWATLPQNWLEKYGERIEQLVRAQDQNGNLPKQYLPELADLCIETDQPLSEYLQNLRDCLENFETIQDYDLPSDLRASLRPYQKQGANWLCFLREAKLGAMLADDMGLGKTLQALCAIRGKTLVICPTSVLPSWKNQIEQFRPGLTVSLYYGNTRKLDSHSHITLTSYALLRIDREKLASEKWDTIILDEAQTIKNPDSQIARAAHSLQASFRIALSGTPIENRLDDLWSQFQFLNPGLLGSRETFQNKFIQPILRGNETAAQELKSKIKPFILRRLKKDVAHELPPKTEKILYCELSSSEREVYETILATTRKEVLEKFSSNGSIFAILELLLRLRQACCHTNLLPGQNLNISSKVNLLLETLEDSIALGHRALVFSQWTSFLDLIEPFLKSKNISYLRLDGNTKNRSEIVENFQADTGPSVMLISLKAGGVGITLTAADHIFLMDPWWNPSVEEQATDRAHRIGQKNAVLVHRIIAQNTIEERILDLQKNKIALANSLLENTQSGKSITREDLIALLN
jgi:superfamily II DNA or RNA helicase